MDGQNKSMGKLLKYLKIVNYEETKIIKSYYQKY
jgi:hypothetical protein